MVSNPNFYGQSTTGTPNQIEDGVDFPHTGLIKALSDGLGQNYAISGFDITGTDATALTVADGKIFRDGELVDVTGDSLTLSSSYTNGYHLLVAPSGASPTVVLRNPTAADKVAEYTAGDTIIAVLTHTGANPLSVQYLTVNKTKNSLSIGEGSGTYSEEMSITSDGTDVTFTGSSNTNMDFTPSGTGKVRVTTGDLEVQNGNFEVPNGYSEITVVESITDGSGAGLTAGAPVYPTNYASGRITVQLADATIADSKYPAIGLVYDTITASGNGKVVVQGLTGDISATLFDAGSYSEGDIIYLSPNVGKLTNTRPTADTDAIQNIGRIVHLSTFTAGSSGTAKILVQGSGRSNDVTNDGFVTTNASSIPTARQITAGTGITLNDGGAGSTLEVVNSAPDQTVSLTGAGITAVTGTYPNFTITSTEADTLQAVTDRGRTTTNHVTVDGFKNNGETEIIPIDPATSISDLASPGFDDSVYYISSTLNLADGTNGQIIHIKNIAATQSIINTTSVVDGSGAATDQRRTGPTQITLETMEGITLQYVNDVASVPVGWYILDTDTDTDTDTGILNVVEDTTPQLGGNLDVNGNDIVSVSNGDITITPDGTGQIVLDGLNWPTADGSADQVLKTDGLGQLSFVDVAGGTVDVVSNVATNTILGRNDAGSGDSEELTPAEVRTMLNVDDGASASGSVAKLDCIAPDSAQTANNWITIDFGDTSRWNVDDPDGILTIAPPSPDPTAGQITIGSSSDEMYLVIIHLWLISTANSTGNGLWIVRGNANAVAQDGQFFYHREQEYVSSAQSAITTPVQFTVEGGTTIESIEYYFNQANFQYRGNTLGTTRVSFLEFVRLK